MKDRVLSFLKEQWFRVLLLFITISFIPLSVTAEYKGQSNIMKRVVAASESQKMRFSSNKLVQSSTPVYSVEYKKTTDLIHADENYDQDYYLVRVFIWNYSVQNPARWYTEDIVYDLSFAFTNRKGEAIDASMIGAHQVKIIDRNIISNNTVVNNDITLSSSAMNSAAVNNYTIRHTLSPNDNSSSYHEYELRFSGNWDLEKDVDICVAMTADPVGSDTELKTLSGAVGLAKETDTPSSSWRAYLNEHPDAESQNNVSNYDGFNLVLAGSGKAEITISWDPDYIELNENVYSPRNHAADGENEAETGNVFGYTTSEISDVADISGGWKTITIHADNKTYRSRYNIQLYKQSRGVYNDWNFFEYNSSANENAYIRVTVVQQSST